MNTIDEFSLDLDAQNLRRIKQRKELCFIQALIQTSSDDENDKDDKDDDLITPIPFKISIPKCNHQKQTPLLKPVCQFERFFSKKRKVPVSGHSGLKSKISEKMLFQL